jgi:hypothetical protein
MTGGPVTEQLFLTPSRTGVSHPLTQGRKQIQFLKRYVFLEHRTMDKVKKKKQETTILVPVSRNSTRCQESQTIVTLTSPFHILIKVYADSFHTHLSQ